MASECDSAGVKAATESLIISSVSSAGQSKLETKFPDTNDLLSYSGFRVHLCTFLQI